MNRRLLTHCLGLLFTAVELSACGPPPVAQQTVQTMYMPGMNMTLAPGTTPYTRVIAAPIDQVWHHLAAAYDSLLIPLTTLDPKTHVVGNEGFKVRQTLGKERLSTFFECGTTQVGPNADSYELYLVVMTQLETRGPDSTRVITATQAAAKPMQFAQDYSRCSSKEVLELRIADIISGALKKAPGR